MLRATVRQSTAEARDPEKLNSATPVPPATSQQLQRHFWISAVPFIGFGVFAMLNKIILQDVMVLMMLFFLLTSR
jgi:hypothetical protein